MTAETELLERVRDALRADTSIRFDDDLIVLALSDGALLVDGEVNDVSIKRRMLRTSAVVIAPRPIIDRLHVRPAQPMADGMIGDLVRDALIEESALANCRIRLWVKGQPQLISDPGAASGAIDIRVEEGVVTLDGEVSGLGHKRLAGALAWWVPGSRDVINGLGVAPPEHDAWYVFGVENVVNRIAVG